MQFIQIKVSVLNVGITLCCLELNWLNEAVSLDCYSLTKWK